eukprot:5949186-Pleurochrysis_carterae.AAC.1
MPSGRLKGPENRSNTVQDVCAGRCLSGISRGMLWICDTSLAGGAGAIGSPGGWSAPESVGTEATGVVVVGAVVFQGNVFSSK